MKEFKGIIIKTNHNLKTEENRKGRFILIPAFQSQIMNFSLCHMTASHLIKNSRECQLTHITLTTLLIIVEAYSCAHPSITFKGRLLTVWLRQRSAICACFFFPRRSTCTQWELPRRRSPSLAVTAVWLTEDGLVDSPRSTTSEFVTSSPEIRTSSGVISETVTLWACLCIVRLR